MHLVFVGPTQWNSLPHKAHHPESAHTFKVNLFKSTVSDLFPLSCCSSLTRKSFAHSGLMCDLCIFMCVWADSVTFVAVAVCRSLRCVQCDVRENLNACNLLHLDY